MSKSIINPLAKFQLSTVPVVFTSYRIRNPNTKQVTIPLTPKAFRFVLSQITAIETNEKVFVTDAMIDELFPTDGDYHYMHYIVRRETALTVDQIVERLMVADTTDHRSSSIEPVVEHRVMFDALQHVSPSDQLSFATALREVLPNSQLAFFLTKMHAEGSDPAMMYLGEHYPALFKQFVERVRELRSMVVDNDFDRIFNRPAHQEDSDQF